MYCIMGRVLIKQLVFLVSLNSLCYVMEGVAPELSFMGVGKRLKSWRLLNSGSGIECDTVCVCVCVSERGCI